MLWEIERHPTRYAGAVLMCPAVSVPELLEMQPDAFSMPLWMLCGERDTAYAASCRRIRDQLSRGDDRVYYHEVPGGGHGAPCAMIDWPEALRFVAEDT